MFVIYFSQAGYNARIHQTTCHYYQKRQLERLPYSWWYPKDSDPPLDSIIAAEVYADEQPKVTTVLRCKVCTGGGLGRGFGLPLVPPV